MENTRKSFVKCQEIVDKSRSIIAIISIQANKHLVFKHYLPMICLAD